MPAVASDEFGAKYMEQLGGLGVHTHSFPSANSALGHWMGDQDQVELHRKYLEGTLRVDIFGLKEGGAIDGDLQAPLADTAQVEKGKTYLIETVLRTMKLGHHFSQGTTDSNQIWIEMTATQGGRLIGQSGHRDDREVVDSWSHFVNTFMLDRDGNRINRRNAQNIFTPLYSHQMPPGAGQSVHYKITVPDQTNEPIVVTAKLLYRKFDTEYLDYIRADRDPEVDPLDLGQVGDPNDLPIIEIASDTVSLLVVDQVDPDFESVAVAPSSGQIPEWQRWNDYGIGLLLKGKAELKQAGEAFAEVEALGRFDGPLNMARVQFAEGDLNGATESLTRAGEMDPPPPSWTHGWLSGIVNRQQGNLEAAAESLRAVLQTKVPERGFDFSLDYAVRNALGLTLVDLAQRAEVLDIEGGFEKYSQDAIQQFQQVLDIDAENVTAHANLAEIYGLIGDTEQEQHHRMLHTRYKPDDNAAEVAIPAARRRYPAANHAAEALVIYDMQRTEVVTDAEPDVAAAD